MLNTIAQTFVPKDRMIMQDGTDAMRWTGRNGVKIVERNCNIGDQIIWRYMRTTKTDIMSNSSSTICSGNTIAWRVNWTGNTGWIFLFLEMTAGACIGLSSSTDPGHLTHI